MACMCDLKNQACFLREFTGLGSPIHNRFIACQKTLEGRGYTDGEEKMSFNQKQTLHKILFSPWPDSPAISLTPTVKLSLSLFHMHTLTVKLKCSAEKWWETCDF